MSKGIDYILDQVIPDIMGTNNYLPSNLSNVEKPVFNLGKQMGNNIASLSCQPAGFAPVWNAVSYIPPLGNPGGEIAKAADILYRGYKEMNDMGRKYVNLYGTKNLGTEFSTQDDYAHSKSMCKAAQVGPYAFLGAQTLGLLKEGLYDIPIKLLKGMKLWEILADSGKDLKNNLKGGMYGLLHPGADCDEAFSDKKPIGWQMVEDYYK